MQYGYYSTLLYCILRMFSYSSPPARPCDKIESMHITGPDLEWASANRVKHIMRYLDRWIYYRIGRPKAMPSPGSQSISQHLWACTLLSKGCSCPYLASSSKAWGYLENGNQS